MIVWILFFMVCIGLIGLLTEKILFNELKIKSRKIIEEGVN